VLFAFDPARCAPKKAKAPIEDGYNGPKVVDLRKKQGEK
jgi:hypothetical protein